MNWTELLELETRNAFRVTRELMDLVDDSELGWKPATGSNWMTVGQLLMHLATSTGAGMRGMATGEWGLPEGVKMEDLPPEDMLPPAEKLPTVDSVAQAKELLEADRKLAEEMIEKVGEADLAGREIAVPWNPDESFALGRHFLHALHHLTQHKGQLFYYLKLMGKKVDTSHLWGM